MDVTKGEHLLDLCAAPGGKTALMSELTGDSGTVCACELKWNRLMSVIETAKRMKLENIYPLLCDGAYPPFNGFFDKILLDAPCSGTGVLHRHPEARWIRKEDILSLAEAEDFAEFCSITMIRWCNRLFNRSLEPEENQKQMNYSQEHPSFCWIVSLILFLVS